MRLHVIIMCKAPVAGAVKTRLLAEYTPDEAAHLHAGMATVVIKRAARMFDDVFVAVDEPGHPFFSRFDLPFLVQGEGDLGTRIQRLMQTAFANHAEAVLFLGTDSPHMQDERLLAAADLLGTHDVVVGPVEDGGYDLIALAGPFPLFEKINWSTDQVLNQTIRRIQELDLSFTLLNTGFDIDFPEDVARAGWKFT